MALKNIALIGKGGLGSAVLYSLVDAGFTVTVVGRIQKKAGELPTGVKSVTVDYSSHESLITAFKGIDAVVSTVGFDGLLPQKGMIDAAIEAGVTRFIPADYGTVNTDPSASHLLIMKNFVEIQNYLKDKAAQGKIEYTFISCGLFTEYIVPMLDWRTNPVPLWEGGHHTVSTTSMAGIGKAIAGALSKPEATRNRNIKIHEAIFTQAEILAIMKSQVPAGTELNPPNIDNPKVEVEKVFQTFEEDPSLPNTYATFAAIMFSGLWKAGYSEVDNDLVGLPFISKEELRARVVKALE